MYCVSKLPNFQPSKISKSKTITTENDHLGSVAEQLYLSPSVNFFVEAVFENILISGIIQLEKKRKIPSQEFQILHIQTGLRKICAWRRNCSLKPILKSYPPTGLQHRNK